MATKLLVLLLCSLALVPFNSWSASSAGYLDNKPLVARLKELAREHKKFLRVTKVCDTHGKNEVWRVELGTGTDDERVRRPAMLVVAGIEGNDLAGTAIAVAWMESLAKSYAADERVRKLLDSTTIHVWPRVNPDGAKAWFAKPRRETATNDQPFDDDHDGLLDEDGPDDLDGDGLITSMRVEDPDGDYILDPLDSRLLLKADRQKGERGAWRLFSEGRDNDGDSEWNEDSIGGVNFNRNFPFGYKFFAPDSGRHQVSEVETRSLADFIIAHPEIGIVFTYGAADNLAQTPKGEAPKRPPVALHETDVAWYRWALSPADLTDAPASHPVGHAAVSAQEYVVFWKVPISPTGSGTVLAYHKDTPRAGGSVIMQDGSVKTMSAEEFAAAPKAKK